MGCKRRQVTSLFFFFNDTATTEIYTLSLHDALPICLQLADGLDAMHHEVELDRPEHRSEEHTSELQSRPHLVCRLLLEKKKPFTAASASQRRFPVTTVSNNRSGPGSH